MGDGTDYRGELAGKDDCSFEEFLAQAETTVFSSHKRGLAKKLRGLIQSGHAAVRAYQDEAAKRHVDTEGDEAFQQKLSSVRANARQLESILAECKIMFNSARDNKTSLAIRQSRVDDELARTQAAGPGAAEIELHKALKTKALEFMRG